MKRRKCTPITRNPENEVFNGPITHNAFNILLLTTMVVLVLLFFSFAEFSEPNNILEGKLDSGKMNEKKNDSCLTNQHIHFFQ